MKLPKLSKKSKKESFAEIDFHDGNVPPSEDYTLSKVETDTDQPCTTLPSVTGGKTQENGTSEIALVVPDSEGKSAVQILREKRMKLTGAHLPQIHCNVCIHSAVCPQYRAGYECAYLPDLMKSIQGIDDVKLFMRFLAETELTRAQWAVISEKLSGGAVDDGVTSILQSAFDKLDRLRQIEEDVPPPGKGSVFDQLFGSMLSKAKEVEAELVEDHTDEIADEIKDSIEEVKEV